MKKIIYLTSIILSLSISLNAQNTEAGSIAFTAFNGDDPDVLAFVVLKEIPANISIFFNENEWQGSAFNNSNEGILEWSNSSITAPGTVVILTSGTTASVGSVSVATGSFNLGGSNEAVFAYTGTSASPTFFLAAVSNEAYSLTVGSLAGTGLVEGETAVNFDGDEDIGVLDLSIDCTGDTRIECATKFNTASNWITQDGSGNQSTDGVAPDVPGSIIGSHTIPTTFGILPVELTKFAASKDLSHVNLEWQTATEINNERFEIERSSDAGRFENIGSVKGEGNSSRLQDYSFVDAMPLNGINYYRLKQIDIDGAFAYSDVVSVKMNRANIRITPTSTFDFVTVNTGAQSSLVLRNINGQVMDSQSDSEGNFTIEMANYAQGIYFLTIDVNGSIQTKKVVRL